MNKRVIQYLFWLEEYKMKVILFKGKGLYIEKKGKDVKIMDIINKYVPLSVN